MKIPDVIDIKGSIWEVKWVDNLGEGQDWGECDTSRRVISIGKSIPRHEKNTVFLHEVFHAIIHEIGLYNTQLSDDLEEIIVTNLAEWVGVHCTVGLKRK